MFQRGAEYSIMLGGNELMNSRLSGSEEALARLACEKLAGRSRPRLLIGGLGMGFTLRAALEAFPTDAELIVAELVPGVVAWGRGPLADLFAGSMADPRVTIVEADVGDFIGTGRGSYDAILLDVDNGPDGLSRAENDKLYTAAGLSRARGALRLGGVLGVWSSAPDKAFTQRLQRSGFSVDELVVRARGTRGARHVIWIAVRDG